MPATVANIAKGRFNELLNRVNNNDPVNSAWVIVLLQAGEEALATLEDYDDLAALLVPAANQELTVGGYARVVLTDVDVGAPVVDDTGNTQGFTFTDITPALSAVAAGENISAAVICYDDDSTGGTDANLVVAHIQVFASDTPTNGSDINYDFPATNTLLQATN